MQHPPARSVPILANIALLLAMPSPASAHLITDITREQGMVALAHDGITTAINRQLDVATVRLEQWRGRTLVALDFQHGAPQMLDAGDGSGGPRDHASMMLAREIYLGASIARPVAPGVNLFAGAGALQTVFHDQSILGNPVRQRDRTMDGWRLSAGAQGTMGRATLRLEYRLSRGGDARPGEAMALAGSARGRVMLGVNAAF